MEFEPVGFDDEIDVEDLKPVTIPIVGYRVSDDGEEAEPVVTTIAFAASVPVGVTLDVMKVAINGKIDGPQIVAYLEGCVADEDKQKMSDLLHGTGVQVSYKTLAKVYEVLSSHYAGRPISQPSESRGKPGSTKQTSGGAARSRESTPAA